MRSDLDPFVDFINQNFDQIIRAFPNQLTLAENFRGIFKSVDVTNNVATSIDTGGVKPVGVLLLKSANAVRSLSSTVLSNGNLSVTFKFDIAITAISSAVTFSSPFATYQIDSATGVEIGDRITVSGFGNKTNNGTFLVLEKPTANTAKVMNTAAVAETKSSPSGTREPTKTVDLFILT